MASDNSSSDEVTKFYFSFEQVVSARQTGTLRAVKHSLWEPPTDVYETESAIHVRVEIAAMRSSTIHIHLQGKTLVISGMRARPETVETMQAFHQMEIDFGEFRRAISLPYEINPETASARYNDGFLDITLPRA